MVTKQYNFRLIVPVIICLLFISTIVFDACTTQPAPVIPPTTQPAPIIPPTTPTPVLPNSELKVYFVDVGQGDSILIDSGDTEVLVDGGDKAPGAVSFLKNRVDGALEVMVATHPHADHIGGLNAVLADFKVDDIWLNGDTSSSATYSEFMSAVNAEGAAIHTAKRGDTIRAGDLSLDVLNPSEPFLDSTNNRSIVLLLHYGDIDFLFTGDAEREAETSMLTAGLIPDVEVLKVGHHGSRTASSRQFLEACQPEVAIYMAGKGNSFGHPHQETITALTDIGAKIYGTDVNGNICITTDGKAYTVQLEKQALPPLPPSPPQPVISEPSPPTPTACPGATAICNDGTCSYSAHRSGTCSHHGGVRQWVNRPPN
jgi:beta-lactamase superfamily II metal-dependent hydrolase